METPLLRTKLQRTVLGNPILARPRLLQRLDAGMSASVTLVVAPAGFGKSTLVSNWIEQMPSSPFQTEANRPHTGWLSLDEQDSHLPTFIHYLIATIEDCFPHCCQQVSQLLQERPLPTIETLAAVLVNLLSQQEESLVLVLDDLHRVNDSAVFAFLARFIEYQPSQVHMILISRSDPPLPLSRWRAAGRLRELRLHDLSFTLEETTAFFRENLDDMPPVTLVEAIHRRTEGWIVGNWLALLALRGRTDYIELVDHFQTQTNRYTVDYLVDEVLTRQSSAAQRFLVCTAILNRFTAGVCAAVLQIGEEKALAQINHLLQSNLFLIELDTSARWYRYHHQFQEMLLSRLYMRYDQAAIAGLHRRAAAWMEAHESIGEALHHLTAISDYEAVADLVDRQRVNTLNELMFWELEMWLNQVPESLLRQRADLLIGMAWVKHDRVDNKACLTFVQRAADLLEGDLPELTGTTRQLLTAETIALQVGADRSLASEEALALVRRSWALLRHNIPRTHCSVILSLAYTSQQQGDLDFAMKVVRTTLDVATDWPLVARCRIAHAAGFFHFCGGNTAEAKQQFQQNLQLAQQHNLLIIGVISRHGLAAIADVHNRLDEAEQHHLEVINHPYLTSGRDAVVDMYGLIGIYARRGEPQKSRLLIEQLREDAKLMGKPFFLEQVTALEAYANLTCGKVKSALLWALSTSHRNMEATADRIPLIRVRVLLAEGSHASLSLADQILQGLFQYYKTNHVWYRHADILILRALVQDELENADLALAYLAEAVQLAVPNGGVGLFMGHGDAMVRMLRRLGQQSEYSAPARLLLTVASTAEEDPGQTTPGKDLPEPLTERELDVLRLLAARYSNKEIAAYLVVSPHTVRNHTANIYGKLQVKNRREAVEYAHSVGLLPTTVERT